MQVGQNLTPVQQRTFQNVAAKNAQATESSGGLKEVKPSLTFTQKVVKFFNGLISGIRNMFGGGSTNSPPIQTSPKPVITQISVPEITLQKPSDGGTLGSSNNIDSIKKFIGALTTEYEKALSKPQTSEQINTTYKKFETAMNEALNKLVSLKEGVSDKEQLPQIDTLILDIHTKQISGAQKFIESHTQKLSTSNSDPERSTIRKNFKEAISSTRVQLESMKPGVKSITSVDSSTTLTHLNDTLSSLTNLEKRNETLEFLGSIISNPEVNLEKMSTELDNKESHTFKELSLNGLTTQDIEYVKTTYKDLSTLRSKAENSENKSTSSSKVISAEAIS